MKKTQIKANKCGRARKSLLCVASIVLVISSGIFIWMDKAYQYKNNENIKEIKQNTTEVKKIITNELNSQTIHKAVILQNLKVQQQNSKTSITATEQIQPQVSSKQKSSDNFMDQVEQIIFAKVNQERAKATVGALSYSSTMEKYARIKSKDMGRRGYFNHKDLEGNLITTKMKSDGIRYNAWGENIAYIGGVSSDANALATQFMTNWMNSPGHRDNILSNEFKGMGIGVYKLNNKVYATQEFFR